MSTSGTEARNDRVIEACRAYRDRRFGRWAGSLEEIRAAQHELARPIRETTWEIRAMPIEEPE